MGYRRAKLESGKATMSQDDPLPEPYIGSRWETWLGHFRRLVEFAERTGHASPAQAYVD
jgi:hypothetical protein